jgi:tetratricopeptide (TPR) repeat protein
MRASNLVCLLSFAFLIPPGIRGDQAPNRPSASNPPANHSSDDLYTKEPYVFELIDRHVRFESDGKGQRNLIMRIRIQSESAVHEFGLLVYPYASSFESLDIVYVRVRKPDGTILETPPSDVQDLDSAVSREAPMYTDQREKHIAVKSLAVGDILEAQLRWTIHEPMAPGHFWFDHSYYRAGICLQETLEIDVPVNVPVKLRNPDPQPSIREEGGRRLYTFKSANLKKPEESKIPEWEKDFHGAAPPDIQLSSFTSWDEVGKWFGGLEQPKVAVTAEIRAKAEELTKGKTSEEEKLRAIYDFVSTRFRYIGIDLGLGRYSPHAASEVLVNRYGDCKDKHTLFAALLQAAGITAFPALISSKYRVDSSLPTMSLFDHVITAIPQGDAFLFLDTAPEVAPFGLLMQSIRDRKALVIPGSTTARIITTPADPPFLNFEHVQIDASIDVGGTLDAKMRFEDRGDSELVLRLAYRATPQNRWQELTQNIVARMGFAGTVSDVSVAQPEDTDKPFWMSFSYHRTDFPDWKNHRIVLPSPPFLLPDLTEEQKVSKEPLPLGSLEEVTYDSKVKFPEGYSAVLPAVPEQKTDFAEFSAGYSFEKGVLHGTLHLKTLQHEIPGSKRGEFSKMAKAVDEAQRRFIFVAGNFPIGAFMPNPNLLGTGKPEELIPALEKALAGDPDNYNILLSLSRAYSDAGRPSDAVAVLQKAISNHPDVPHRLLLALGFAYLRVPDAEKAMIQFKKGLGDDPTPDELNDVAYSLAEANLQLDDALSYSKRAVSSLAAQTMDISPDEARPSDFGLMPKLAANWDTLGWIEFRKGDTATAEKYLEAAWQLMQSAAIGEHLVEAYEKLGRKQKAAAVCNMAEAALGVTALPPDAALRQKISEELKRLRPLLTSSSSASPSRIRARVPDAHVALADMRSLNIPLPTKLRGESARANFVISITNGSKADNVVFLSGTEELRNAIAAIAGVKYQQTFPDDTPTRILRKASLNCSVYAKDCQLFFTTVQEASSLPPIPVFLKHP